jgi:uncharacterized membrane protein YjfL (UPF0719 family)
MNLNLLLLSVIHLIMAIFVGVLVLYFSYYFTNRMFRKKGFLIEKNNIAFGIFMSAILLSVGIVVSSAYSPSMSLLQVLQKTCDTRISLFLHFSMYFLLFLTIALLVSFLINMVSIKLYTFLTRNIEEFEEISQNNIQIALMTGVIIIVIAIFAKDSMAMIIESLIPYPKIGLIN